jgi:hypothetical protein
MEKYKNKLIGITIIGFLLKIESLPFASILLLIGLLGLAVYYLTK